MDTKNSIFKNRLLLNYKDDFIQADFNKIQQNQILKGNLLFLSITLLLSILETVLQTTNKEIYVSKNITWYYITVYTSISISAITLLNLILIFFVKIYKFQKISTLLSYILLTLSLLMLRVNLIVILNKDETQISNALIILFLAELTGRFVLFYLNMITFFEGLVANIFCIISLTTYSELVYGSATSNRILYGYIAKIAFLIIHTYLNNFEMKKTFYVNYHLEKRNKWHTNVMNNRNSGFICIKDKKIDFVNFPMLNKIKRNKEISKILEKCEILNDISRDQKEDNILLKIPGKKIEKTNEEMLSIIRDDKEVCKKIMDVVLCDFNDDKISEKDHKSSSKILFADIAKPLINTEFYNKNCNLIGQFSSNDFLEKFQSDYLNKNIDEHFYFVGYKDLEVQTQLNGVTTTELINMEVTGRFYKSIESQPIETFEFIFKDITRTKQIGEKNAEFKYKTLFLSKVAHEFKNPIICIIELVNQINDGLKQNEELELTNNLFSRQLTKKKSINRALNKFLPIIKALSNYLLILVKDLDFFSQNQIGGSSQKLEIDNADLNEILEFCAEISNGLLNRNNKQSNVSFLIEKGLGLPEKILTDDTKLKQILINLISNAIKFTDHGNVTLRVDVQREGILRFQVEDTGPGMTEEQKSNLFKPYFKSNSINNKIGAGLGLTIVSDLVTQFGGSITFDSKLGEGTKFWFDLNYVKNNIPNQSEMSFISHRLEKKKSLFHKIQGSDIELDEINLKVIKKYSNNSIAQSIKSDSSQTTIKQKMMLSHPCMRQEAQIINVNNSKVNNDFLSKEIIPSEESKLSKLSNSDRHNSRDYFFDTDPTTFNYIVADDEKFTRKAVIRVLTSAAKKLNKKVNLIESEDGIETLFIIYQSVTKGVNIAGIISDETMNLMTGSKSAQLLKSINKHSINRIPFFTTTAYDNNNAIESLVYVDAVYHKPIKIKDAENILSKKI